MSDELLQPVRENPAEAVAPRRRRLGWIIGIAVLVIVLVGAAFLAGRLLNGSVSGTPGFVTLPGGGQISSMQTFSLDMGEPPEELPKAAPDAMGVFIKRNDNVVTLGTGQGGVMVMSNADGSVDVQAPEGPQQEVVVTRDTKIYRDATFDDLKDAMPGENETIQQKVAESDLDELGNSSFVRVWGRKSGDRIIADVLLFNSPMIFQKSE